MNFDDRYHYRSARSTNFGEAGVAASEPLAASAGLRVLAAGGSAVDAAIATAATLAITEPVSNGLGSDAFALVWDGSKVHGLNASGRAPAAWTPEYFAGRTAMPNRGWDTVTIPGAISAWAALSERFGKLPFADLLTPAIDYARNGYGVGPVTTASWRRQEPDLIDQPGWADAFRPGGRVPATGERFILKGAADALELIAATRGEAFYKGAIAEAIVARSQADGGAHTMDDFASHTADWVTPITMDAYGLTVHEIPPNGQGIAALIALGLMDRLDLGDEPDSVRSIHLQIEAVKVALADLYAHVADLEAMRVSPAELLDPAYLDERVKLIDPDRAQTFETGKPLAGGTVILTTADADGMMVSFIQSNYEGFGSGCVEPTFGVSLQNRGKGFSLDPASPNLVAPRKRPFHTIIPGFVTKGADPVMAFGVMGGPIQAQAHAQFVTRVGRFGQGLQTAADAPRFRVLQGLTIAIETHFPAATLEGLAALGHVLDNDAPGAAFGFGGAQAIMRVGDLYAAASDPRKDGHAVVL
ncbi:gamma-glutamyltransferase family protein [Acuticoccus mangrovi]|uniref:Gamma-glutamyltransferase family protein n=1 Tax=Acuticoccus mangrovi TaxID=2796142 RepID=A0A934MEV1_9HYPH|nr:gamma-glutamyltransferase family protein [Acuticoccus mangrovi]MBJ3774778.1 gamma-glutamyltransferase family protein [Acuticoccus mangrovi]